MICYIAGNSLNLAINGGHRSTFAGNSALLPSDVVIDFAMLLAQRFWRETVSLIECHVNSKEPMTARAVGKTFPAI